MGDQSDQLVEIFQFSKMSKISPIFLLVALVGFSAVAHQEQVDASQQCLPVSLKNGKVLGAVTGTQNSRQKVCAYTGIPYARPPVGELRFQPPQPAKRWGTLNATKLPSWCPQDTPSTPRSGVSEDCLYLNVFEPKRTQRIGSGLPVMIWFHGGAFTSSSSHIFTPTRLLSKGDVILVVVQYRLGLLGFLSTGSAEVPGNNGLKDQAFAIKWVNQNIKAFGGNPNKITIFGESAGGASVNFQLISPLNKGLIHGVIAQSGTSLSHWAIDRNPAESAKIMARRLGCSTMAVKKMVTCLKKVPWQKIVKEQSAYILKAFQTMNYPYATITPVIEPKHSGAFISEEPATHMKRGNIPNVPVMLGGNKHEGSVTLAFMHLLTFGPKRLDKNPDYMKHQIIPDILKYINAPEMDPGNRAVASSVELAFLSGVNNRASWNESMPGLVDALSVMGFKSSIQNTAEILSGRNQKVYLYSFEYASRNTMWPPVLNRVPVAHGVAHGDELFYLFDFPSKYHFTRQDQAVSDIMCDMWRNFAKTGNPTPHWRHGQWEAYSSLREPYMKLSSRPTLVYGYRKSWRPNGSRGEVRINMPPPTHA